MVSCISHTCASKKTFTPNLLNNIEVKQAGS